MYGMRRGGGWQPSRGETTSKMESISDNVCKVKMHYLTGGLSAQNVCHVILYKCSFQN